MVTAGSALADVPWQTILDQAAGPVAVFDRQARFVYANPALCRLLGYDSTELLQHHPRDFTHPDDPAVDREAIERLIAEPTDSFEVEKRFLRSDGRAVWTLVTSSIIRDHAGTPLFFLSQLHNITVRREVELRWQRTVTNAPIGMALLDLEGHWTEVNDRLCDLLGYSREELLGKHFAALTYFDETTRLAKILTELLEHSRDAVSTETLYRHKDGRPVWMLTRSSVVPGADNRPAYLVSQYETLSEQMQDRHLAHMALHDPLTGLANRALLSDRLEQELAELPSQKKSMLVILLVDVDNLKPINDQYGHAVGDQLLTTTADELLNSIRTGDTVARIGGDEFVVLSHVPNWIAAKKFRDRVAARLNSTIVAADHPLELSASVGFTATANSTTSQEALLHSADRDMYRHKTLRRS